MGLPEILWQPLPSGRIPLITGHHLQQASVWEPYLQQPIFIITDSTIAPLYLESWLKFFQSLTPIPIDTYIMPAGEANKTVRTAEAIWEALLQKHHTRYTTLIALGGGVVSDITGFVAANYLRGIRFITLPTTLLSQIDASLGGKCGVNHPLGKNLIGTIHQPTAVFVDTAFLTHLPNKVFHSGLAEAVKYGFAFDHYLLTFLENHTEAILARDLGTLHTLVKWCCQCKLRVLSVDELDTQERLLLNFGHTVAHALEGYVGLDHGEAVALGMLVATHLSIQKGKVPNSTLERLKTLLHTFQLPTVLPATLGPLKPYLQQDKKRGLTGLRWVLLSNIGHCELIDTITDAEIETAFGALEALYAE
jgi:3-dehydroquinate synthase